MVKLIDFGLAVFHEGEKLEELIGTPYYVCPEITLR